MLQDFTHQLTSLQNAAAYRRLQAYEPPFNPYHVLGIPHRELSHSRLLAWLLEHKELAMFRAALIRELAERAAHKSYADVADVLRSVGTHAEAVAYTERGGLDVVLDLGIGEVSIGIENKIWAHERKRQLQKYQQYLAKRSRARDQRAIIVFLTPRGTEAYTADRSHAIPVIELSWKEVAQLLEKWGSPNDAELRHFVNQTVRHIREDIMEDRHEKRLVRDLLRDPAHRMAIRRIVDNLPTLADHESEWTARVREYLAPNLTPKFELHRRAGELKEIKVYIEEWLKYDLPICLMLYNYDDQASVRTLVKRDQRNSDHLASFARAHSDVVDVNFPELEDWCWHRVFAGETDVPPQIFSIIDDDFVDCAFGEFARQHALLLPAVTEWVNERTGKSR